MQIDHKGFLRKKITIRSKGSPRGSRELTATANSRFRDTHDCRDTSLVTLTRQTVGHPFSGQSASHPSRRRTTTYALLQQS